MPLDGGTALCYRVTPRPTTSRPPGAGGGRAEGDAVLALLEPLIASTGRVWQERKTQVVSNQRRIPQPLQSPPRHRSHPHTPGASSELRSPSSYRSFPGNDPGEEEEEGGLSLSLPPRDHPEPRKAARHLTRKIKVLTQCGDYAERIPGNAGVKFPWVTSLSLRAGAGICRRWMLWMKWDEVGMRWTGRSGCPAQGDRVTQTKPPGGVESSEESTLPGHGEAAMDFLPAWEPSQGLQGSRSRQENVPLAQIPGENVPLLLRGS
ncbi:uncharacterized protein LOC127482035 [Manacus candei]|uniref:uncharacterized protein LOC127482035 n=1 Tax=Manacus candei TaxID=415023 RepID=UPI002226132D|nr:uncharacterized protein LOC127482035 [Manacus candei]